MADAQPDWTPYDLAARARRGWPITATGHREVAAELDAVRILVEAHQQAGVAAEETIKALLERMRAER